MSSNRLGVSTTIGRGRLEVEKASTVTASGSWRGKATTMPCASIRRTRWLIGPAPSPQWERSARAAPAGSRGSAECISPPANPGRSTAGSCTRFSSAYASSHTCSTKATALARW